MDLTDVRERPAQAHRFPGPLVAATGEGAMGRHYDGRGGGAVHHPPAVWG